MRVRVLSRDTSSMVSSAKFFLTFFIILENYLGICSVVQLPFVLYFVVVLCLFKLGYMRICFSMVWVLLVEHLCPMSSAQGHTERVVTALRLLASLKKYDICPWSTSWI